MNTTHIQLHMSRKVDFSYALTTYVIYPWIAHDNELIRPLRLGPDDQHVVLARTRQASPDCLDVAITGADGAALLDEAKATLVRCLQLDYPYDAIAKLAGEDRILAAALRHRGYGQGKLYPDLFEALCGVICAQRTSFARIYSMMRKLAETFGDRLPNMPGLPAVYAFPKPERLAAASDAELRACSVGFRARGLASVASYFARQRYTWHEWQHRDPAAVISELLGIKGVGPYTANLATNLSYGRGGAPHIDSYVTKLIAVCYLSQPTASETTVMDYVQGRWGDLAEHVLDLLTTDTEIWTAELGLDVGVRSGARST